MQLLILGGTRFLGRHLVEAALARAHDITLFHRGTNPVAARSHVATIYGDRHRDLAQLHGRRWDAVIDTCGYHPHTVRTAAGALADAVQQYTFISSASVYADYSVASLDETAPVGTPCGQNTRTDLSASVCSSVLAPTHRSAKRSFSRTKCSCHKPS